MSDDEEKIAKRRAYAKAYYAANTAKKKAYYAENVERILANKKEYREKNAAQIKAYRDNNAEKRKPRDKLYRIANANRLADYAKAYYKAYYIENSDKLKSSRKAYFEANRDKCKALRAKRRVRQIKQHDLTTDMVKVRAKFTDARRLTNITGVPYHVDHILPVSKGGSDHQDNLVVMRGDWNLKKGAEHWPWLAWFNS